MFVIVTLEAPEVIRSLLVAGESVRVLDIRFGRPRDAGCEEPGTITVPRDTSVSRLAGLLRNAAGRDGIRGVVAVSDSHLALSADLNAELGTPGASPAASALMADKSDMRARLAQRGLFPMRWRPIRRPEDAAAFAREVSGPVIVKPTRGSGSRHIFLIEGPLSPSLARFTAQFGRETAWIGEEYLLGPEFSVETLSWGGSHTVLGVTQKDKNENFVELGHCFPAAIADDLADALACTVRQTLDCLGLDNSLGHTEVIVTADGCRVVETHNRLGGDRIGRLVELATGVHPVSRLARVLAGQPQRSVVSTGAAAAIRFLSAQDGVVTAISGVEEARRLPGVQEVVLTVRPSDTVRSATSSQDRVGHVIAACDSPDAARSMAERAAETIRVSVA
jgi:biotin carboxylase